MAGIVLIDLHQQRKATSDNTNQRHLNTERTHVNEQNPQNNNPQHPLSNQMIEQINIALEQKGSNFSAWVIEACNRRLTSEKRAYTSIKSDEE